LREKNNEKEALIALKFSVPKRLNESILSPKSVSINVNSRVQSPLQTIFHKNYINHNSPLTLTRVTPCLSLKSMDIDDVNIFPQPITVTYRNTLEKYEKVFLPMDRSRIKS
jgi:hypothetical protein